MAITAVQIRGARAMLGMLQGDLAAAAGISNKALTSIETGAAKPRASTLERLQAALEGAGANFIESEAGVGVMVKVDR